MRTPFLLAGISLWRVSSACLNASVAISSSISTPAGTLTVTDSAKCACAQLLDSFPDNVILPGRTNYTQQTVDSYWDVRSDLSPACVFMPETADAVSSALKILSSCNAQFAVRGGGHMNVSHCLGYAPYK